MPFPKDLRKGHEAEDFILALLVQAGLPASSNDNRKTFSDFDLTAEINNRPFTIEAKYDLFEKKSGNIAIEFFNPKSNQPTGIDATKADLWVHVLDKPMSAWVTNVATLRRYIRTHDPVRVVERGGDSNASMLLYKREVIFADIFYQLDGLSPQSVRNLLLKLLGPKFNARRSHFVGYRSQFTRPRRRTLPAA